MCNAIKNVRNVQLLVQCFSVPPLKAERVNNTPFELATVNVLVVQGLASSVEGGASCGCCFYFLAILPTIINPDTGLGRL